MSSTQTFAETFGEPISVYTRAQAIEDGMLVDMTEWASAEKGFHGGFTCPVAMTSKLWAAVSPKRLPRFQDARGRAHDVLFMASLAVRSLMRKGESSGAFRVLLHVGRTRNQVLRVVVDGDGVTIGFREDEW
jgi:hypothetical protein